MGLDPVCITLRTEDLESTLVQIVGLWQDGCSTVFLEEYMRDLLIREEDGEIQAAT
jgi:hypothetical protein